MSALQPAARLAASLTAPESGSICHLANTLKPETFELATEFLAKEIDRTAAMGADVLVLHPGSHVGAG